VIYRPFNHLREEVDNSIILLFVVFFGKLIVRIFEELFKFILCFVLKVLVFILKL